MKVKDGKGDEYDAICKKTFIINSGNITLDYLGGSCPFEINTNPERWNTIKPGRSMLDIKGEIITTDAMGCQKDIAEKIQKQGGNYLFAVKGHKERINKAFE